MTQVEMENNPSWQVTGGYLKTFTYEEAWRRSWDKASVDDKKKTLKLPNWNNEIFKQITGIDVEKELGVNRGA